MPYSRPNRDRTYWNSKHLIVNLSSYVMVTQRSTRV